MEEPQVVVVTRPPHGRKRTGGGYIGRSKRWDGSSRNYPRRQTGKLSRRQQEIVGLLSGPDWKTRAEIAALTGLAETGVVSRLSEIRRSGVPDLTLLCRRRPIADSRKIWWPAEYRIGDGGSGESPPPRLPRTDRDAPSLAGRRLSERDRSLAERLAGSDWKTTAAIQADTGLSRNTIWACLCRIRYCGAPEFTLLRRRAANPSGAHAGRSEYLVEKG